MLLLTSAPFCWFAFLSVVSPLQQLWRQAASPPCVVCLVCGKDSIAQFMSIYQNLAPSCTTADYQNLVDCMGLSVQKRMRWRDLMVVRKAPLQHDEAGRAAHESANVKWVRDLILRIVVISCGLGLITLFASYSQHSRSYDAMSSIGDEQVGTKCASQLFPPKYWTGHFNEPKKAIDRPIGKQMFGTIEAQHEIWRHQNPIRCDNKKFLLYVMLGWANGIGSTLHVATVALRAALDTDRILVLYPTPNHLWMNGSYCKDFNTIDECYFEPFTSCSVYDIFGGKLKAWDSIPDIDIWGVNDQSHLKIIKAHVNTIGSYWHMKAGTPYRFHEILMKSGMHEDNWYHWWRAQAVAYFVRPNVRTLRELDHRRQHLFENKSIKAGTISVHIRHNDKWKESPPAADTNYLRLAEELAKKFPDIITKRNIFLSTDDADSFNFFQNVTKWKNETKWNVLWTNVSHFNDSAINPMQFKNTIGWTEEFLNSLLNLELALECDAFVGIYTSNWNRLIDELRSTIRCKAHLPYVDVFQGWSLSNFDW